MKKIAIVAGSNRSGATSTLLSNYIGRLLKEKGFAAEVHDLFERPLPFYSPDQGEMTDDNLQRFKQLLGEAEGIVLATPEYHGSISGVLKNALDHVSSAEFSDKPVLAVSSAGGPVGVSSLNHIQTIVRNMHGINCPEWISVGGDQRSFDSDGTPSHEPTRERVERVVYYFAGMTELLAKR
ncbi:NADPH-dependent FMN reductase [Paenibacillus turpanensis]|uniref:NADPH-dependent FMN reductase n=1 Tax=Paenibacillus turpanensis TaxID=2689078 RepID=UPI001407737E|nr:NADPH-dependent FMN reductase [Paenibacillus turpanensis]